MKIKLLFSFIIIFTTVLLLITNIQPVFADIEEPTYTPKFEPSPDAKRLLGVLTTSGYTKQPNSNYYINLGRKLHIKTDVERTAWSNFLLVPHYHWWQSTDGKNWNEVDKKINGNSSLNFTPTKVGRTYYQLNTVYVVPFTGIGTSYFYSKVATVDVTPKPIPAKEIKVTTKDDYLFNIGSDITRGTTFAYSSYTPFNATEPTIWSVDKPELATVDEDGHVFANTKGISGTAKIIGTVNNKDNTVISDSKDITIGNGLVDQAVPEGKKARFEIQESTSDERENETGKINIEWYKQVGSQDKELVKTENTPTNKVSYETPRVSPKDDGTKYFAKINVKQEDGVNSALIGPATLKVLPPNDPKVEISSIVTNETFNRDNTDTNLNEVTNEDVINYQIDLYNNSKRAIHNSHIILPLHLGTNLESIKVNNEEINNSEYSLRTNENNQELRINLNSLDIHQEKELSISTTVKNIIDRESFDYRISFHGLDVDSDDYTSHGEEMNINYINDKLTSSFKELNFEPITLFESNKLKYRISKNNTPNEVVSIDDQRRDRHPLKLYLKQITGFKNKTNQTMELPVHLRYYRKDSFEPLNNKVLVRETKLGQLFNSIKWHKDEGPLLHVNTNNLTTGDYSSQLIWQFEDSV